MDEKESYGASIAALQTEMKTVWHRLNETAEMYKSINKLITEFNAMNVNVLHIVKEQTEFKNSMAKMVETLDRHKHEKDESIQEIDKRVTEMNARILTKIEKVENQKAIDALAEREQRLNDKRESKRTIIKTIITVGITFISTLVLNQIVTMILAYIDLYSK